MNEDDADVAMSFEFEDSVRVAVEHRPSNAIARRTGSTGNKVFDLVQSEFADVIDGQRDAVDWGIGRDLEKL